MKKIPIQSLSDQNQDDRRSRSYKLLIARLIRREISMELADKNKFSELQKENPDKSKNESIAGKILK